MDASMPEAAISGVPVAAADRPTSTVFLTGVWMAALLGLVAQAIVLSSRAVAGAMPNGAQVVVEVVSGVSWSLIVCAAVSVGMVAGRGADRAMGLLGFVFAPLAFAAAKGTQKGLQWLLDQPQESFGALAMQMGAVKAIEYALLGFLLGRLIRSTWSTLRNHALLGVAFGIVFGAVIVSLTLWRETPPTPRLVGVLVNELIFPVGCSMVIYWVSRFARSGVAIERLFQGGG